jgi:phosphoribosyl-AMP cyclohydrolase / phosphoribosyl-ATP pyrophosphohydrolase
MSHPRAMIPGEPIGITEVERLDFAKGDGLLPVIVQHAGSGAVLMLGYMNPEALRATLEWGHVVFFSRSKGRLWEKGETSGNFLELVDVRADCDADTLLVRALPKGPSCHTGTATCFGDEAQSTHEALGFLQALEAILAQRIRERPEGSYTTHLLEAGPQRMAQKVGEEGVEVALAAVAAGDAELIAESADLLFHLLVLLNSRGIRLEQVVAELAARHHQRTAAP